MKPILLPKIILAPLAGCADLAFRLISREYGAKFCFFEMIDAKSLLYSQQKTFDMLDTNTDDSPIGAQLLGTDPQIMLEGAHILLEKISPDIIDINSACPVKKVTKRGAGAALIQYPKRLYDIIKLLSSKLSQPITVKLRSGYEHTDVNHIIKVAKKCEQAGASTIFLHGRTMTQLYSGSIDYSTIKKVKESVSIPVYGSGNVLDVERAKQMLEETNCDGLLVARGAFGNPWIFTEIEEYLKDGTLPNEKTVQEKIATLKQHLSYVATFSKKPPLSLIGLMRRVSMWYMTQFPHSARVREKITQIKSYEDLLTLIDSILTYQPE